MRCSFIHTHKTLYLYTQDKRYWWKSIYLKPNLNKRKRELVVDEYYVKV